MGNVAMQLVAVGPQDEYLMANSQININNGQSTEENIIYTDNDITIIHNAPRGNVPI